MDVVYVNRDGGNPELAYSLRSLKNVPHHNVWVVGGAPYWLNTDTVRYLPRPQSGSPYTATMDHIMVACCNLEVSDPFMLWNDDFYAMKPVQVQTLHRGRLADLIRQYSMQRTPWSKGMADAYRVLAGFDLDDPVSYENHIPMIIHKEVMRSAVRVVQRLKMGEFSHLRTLYGNMADLGGVEAPDVKMVRRSDPFPKGPWLSSGDATFRATVEPVLRYLFPDLSPYERN